MNLVLREKLAVLVAVVAAVTLAICLWPDDGTTDVGDVHYANHVFDIGHDYRVELPTGSLDLTVRPPTAELDHNDIDVPGLSFDDTIEAGDGERLVALEWELVNHADPVKPTWAGKIPPVDITLVAEGRRIDVVSIVTRPPSEYDSEKETPTAAYVAVPGDGSGMSIEVAFDGVTQTVDLDSGDIDTGKAAGLYEARRVFAGGPDCSSAPDVASGFVPEPVDCETEPIRTTPWLPGLGWVDDAGSRWAVASVYSEFFNITYLGDRESERVEYMGRSARVAVTLDGAAPVDEQVDTDTDPFISVTGTYAFEVTGDPSMLQIDSTYKLRGELESQRGARSTLRLHGELPLHEL